VVLAARGYPGEVVQHSEIRGLDRAAVVPGALVFHGATERRDGRLVSAGGRVLTVCGRGPDVRAAYNVAYAAVDAIDWPDGFCRRDIGWRALAR
jgi:phosphoribosylamine--glycine ligase